jgi:hypothetical protein
MEQECVMAVAANYIVAMDEQGQKRIYRAV